MFISLSLRRFLRMAASKPNVIFVLGAPGSGKGTQCEKIVKEFGYLHLSAGDLLRAERQNPESKDGELINTYIKEGKIVPVEITIGLLAKAMESSGKSNFLIDGFPRNEDNLTGWNSKMENSTNLQFVLFLECPQEICVKRALSRNQGRADDNIDSLKKRFETHMNSTRPIVEHYEKLNLVKTINASGTSDQVFQEVKKLFSSNHGGGGDLLGENSLKFSPLK